MKKVCLVTFYKLQFEKKNLYLNNLTELEDYMEYNKKENKKQKHKKG